jgi:hypothetical protein
MTLISIYFYLSACQKMRKIMFAIVIELFPRSEWQTLNFPIPVKQSIYLCRAVRWRISTNIHKFITLKESALPVLPLLKDLNSRWMMTAKSLYVLIGNDVLFKRTKRNLLYSLTICHFKISFARIWNRSSSLISTWMVCRIFDLFSPTYLFSFR